MNPRLFTNNMKNSDYRLQEFTCETQDGEKISLIIALKKNAALDLNPEGNVDFSKHEKDILIKKRGDLTDTDREKAIAFFEKHYCKSESDDSIASLTHVKS